MHKKIKKLNDLAKKRIDLQEQENKIKEELNSDIVKIVMKHEKNDFQDLDFFKAEIRELIV